MFFLAVGLTCSNASKYIPYTFKATAFLPCNKILEKMLYFFKFNVTIFPKYHLIYEVIFSTNFSSDMSNFFPHSYHPSYPRI